ncbi:hypothetical protein [uncultured Helicobacter sp.]|uniref:hypothetical protein n=1 Tax=uncultured Helicobacter sp. TaxID=175537 RepID=UPI00374FF418
MSLCYFIESKPPSDITESKQAKAIDLGSVCTHSGEGLYPKPRYQVCLANLYENHRIYDRDHSAIVRASSLVVSQKTCIFYGKSHTQNCAFCL